MTDQPPDTMVTSSGRPAVQVERRFPHPVEKVWRAVSRPEHLSTWFPSPVEIDLRTGGAMRFVAFAGDAAEHGQVIAVDPPHRLEFSWGADRMIFELRAVDDGTALTLLHVFDDRAGAASFAAGWHGCLIGLRHVLAGEALPGGRSWCPAARGAGRGVRARSADRRADPDGLADPVRTPAHLSRRTRWDLFLGVDQQTGEQRRAPAVGESLSPYAAPDLVLGTVTALTEHRLLAFDTASGEPGDHVRVELTEGTGHGARLIVTVTGTESTERDPAVEQWGVGAVEHIARAAAQEAVQPV